MGNVQLLNDKEAEMFVNATIDIDKTIIMSDHSQGLTEQSAVSSQKWHL
jgi:hypothetical protein